MAMRESEASGYREAYPAGPDVTLGANGSPTGDYDWLPKPDLERDSHDAPMTQTVNARTEVGFGFEPDDPYLIVWEGGRMALNLPMHDAHKLVAAIELVMKQAAAFTPGRR